MLFRVPGFVLFSELANFCLCREYARPPFLELTGGTAIIFCTLIKKSKSTMLEELVQQTSSTSIVEESNFECEQLISKISNLDSVDLTTFPFKVGRSKHCDLSITTYEYNILNSISKQHFILTKNSDSDCDQTYLTDMSKNGTFINKERVKRGVQVPLKDGTIIGFGQNTDVFVYRKADLPLTNTPTIEPVSNEIVQRPTWGRLIACQMYLGSVDLTNETFRIGRHLKCNLAIDETQLDKSLKSVFSREHLTIFKNTEHPITYIEDHSKYGTYLNGVLIGKNKIHVLQNDDVISVGTQKIPIFMFKRMYSLGTNELPDKLQRTYEPVKVIGKGAVGEVTLGFHKTTCEMVAIKKILKGKSTMSQIHKLNHPSKIDSEVRILRELSHPFIIHLIDFAESAKEVFLVLEYMKGGELTNRILSNIPLTEDNVKVLFYQMVKAIEYLHYKGITHRDLKPENVLLATEDIETLVKVSDFGLSKINEEVSTMETFCGTLQYIAPELFSGPYNRQVDIWSLGVILFYMLSKKLPFGDKREVLHQRIRSGVYTMGDEWKDISVEAIDLVKNMLIINPNNRITIDSILEHPWLSLDTTMLNKISDLLKYNVVDAIDIIAPLDTYRPQKRLRLEESEES